MNNTRIFIVSNKRVSGLSNDSYSYIYVGNKAGILKNDLRDDIGENIASKNEKYNELTAIYWIYKHLKDFANLDYIGVEQFRRMFAFNGIEKRIYVSTKYKNALVQVSNNEINDYFKFYDFIVPYPSNVSSVIKHYSRAHNSVDLPLLLDIIKRKFPHYYKATKEYFNGKKSYFYNAFIFKKTDFIQYCEFIFPIIDEFVKEAKKLPERFYFTERLTGAFIHYLISNNRKAFHIPILLINQKKFKDAYRKTKFLLKNKQNLGIIFKFKPLILFFMPTFMEQEIRRKICKQ